MAIIGSIFTTSSVNSAWYQTIKPSLTPQNWVFPLVWNILFFLIAISLYILWTSSNKKQKNKVALAFGVNFILNILWTFLYFKIQNPLFALYEIIFLWISIVFMISTAYKINKKASYLIIPYLLWVSFAIILNYMSAF